MLVTIEIDVPEQTVRQYEEAGIDWKARAQKLVQDGLPVVTPPVEPVTEQKATLQQPALHEWLQERIREAEAMTDEEKQEAETEVEELKRNLNATRAENGERLLFV